MIEDISPELLTYQQEKLQRFVTENSKVAEDSIVFVGDSIMEFFPLKKFLGRKLALVNRGIAGTDTIWLQQHLTEQVLAIKPGQIYLMIGTNDLGRGYSVSEIVERVVDLVLQIKEVAYFTPIHIISVLPVNEEPSYQKTVKVRRNQAIKALNEQLSSLIGIDYLPIFDAFLDDKGQLADYLTTDGLHLNQEGYKLLANSLKLYL